MRELGIIVMSLALAVMLGCRKGELGSFTAEKAPSEEKAAGEVAPPAPGEAVKYERAAAGTPAAKEPPGVAEAVDIASELKLIKTADLTCEVNDVDEGFERVYAVAAAEKAIVVGTNRALAEQGYALGSMTLKVHPLKFDETLRALREVGRPQSENSTTEDVTQEYVDLRARLENAEATHARYLEILATRTGDVREILEVERELERVTENIERFKGQLRYLDAQIGLSTITVHLEEPHGAVPTGYSFGKAIKGAFRVAVLICIFLIQAVIVLLPFVILALIVIFIIRYYRRWRRKIKQAT